MPCYDSDVCFDAGATEKPRFYLNFITNQQNFLDIHAGATLIDNFLARCMWIFYHTI